MRRGLWSIPEQDRAVMRILKLTRAVEKELLEARERR